VPFPKETMDILYDPQSNGAEVDWVPRDTVCFSRLSTPSRYYKDKHCALGVGASTGMQQVNA
jgi:hypothetical protein